MLKVFVACQNVYEEKYIDKYDLHPLMVVGYEGTVRTELYNLVIFCCFKIGLFQVCLVFCF